MPSESSRSCDTAYLLHDGLKAGKRILFEALRKSARRRSRDLSYVTSSHSLPSGVWTGSGVPVSISKDHRRRKGLYDPRWTRAVPDELMTVRPASANAFARSAASMEP